MHLDHIIGNETTGYGGILRSYLDEPVAEASDWTDDELLLYVNAEHRHLFSVIRGYNEDWFGRTFIFPLTASTYEYFLPMDCVNLRRIEFINASSVSGSSPNYTVNEETANPQEVEDIKLHNKASVRAYNSNFGFRFGTGYYLFDDKVIFEPNGNINSSLYCRLYYSPQAPDLHRGVATAGGASTITLAATATSTTLGEVRPINNYYKGMRIEIISGTGAGQIRRITQYVGSTRVATVDEAWDTVPDNTSVYSIVSPVQEDYQELLALGATMRAKGIKIEDDVSGVGVVYSALMSDMEGGLEKRNHQSNRKVQRSNWG